MPFRAGVGALEVLDIVARTYLNTQLQKKVSQGIAMARLYMFAEFVNVYGWHEYMSPTGSNEFHATECFCLFNL